MPQKLQIEEMNRLDVAAFKAAEKLPLIVVLDNVRSLHNVGSIFRTADAFRLAGVWLCGITATPPFSGYTQNGTRSRRVCGLDDIFPPLMKPSPPSKRRDM